MTTTLEIAAGLVLSGCMVTALTVLAAFELGRLVSRDDEQREVVPAAPSATCVRRAA